MAQLGGLDERCATGCLDLKWTKQRRPYSLKDLLHTIVVSLWAMIRAKAYHSRLISSQIRAVLGFSYYKLVSFFSPRGPELSPLKPLESLSLGLETVKKYLRERQHLMLDCFHKRSLITHLSVMMLPTAHGSTYHLFYPIERRQEPPSGHRPRRQPHAYFKGLPRILLSYRVVLVVW